MAILPVILAGGSGTRLWPLSRDNYPKQFLQIAGENSLLAETLIRIRGIDGCLPPLVLAREEYRFIVAESLRSQGLADSTIVLEPVARNTAPAIAAAAVEALRLHGADTLLLVLPSDHVIGKPDVFLAAAANGVAAAESGQLITFGVLPTAPETGYGYIRAGERLNDGLFRVAEFVEKPNLETAAAYLKAGTYYWNSGMFLLRAGSYLDELKAHAPDILESVKTACAAAKRELSFVRLDKDAFMTCRSDSIDYAVMEKTSAAAVIPIDAAWSDLGSWNSLADIGKADDSGNVCSGDVIVEGTRNSFIYSDGRLVATVGVQDHIIIETADAVLVASRERAQDVKRLVQKMQDSGRREVREHRKVFRPWGSYEDLVEGPRYRVKHIVVNPGASLSLQKHHHRAEHWVVVRGTASVICGDRQTDLGVDQSTYIPLGEKHRLSNPGTAPLEIVEVQTGDYVGEDDIVRFDDVYGRGSKG